MAFKNSPVCTLFEKSAQREQFMKTERGSFLFWLEIKVKVSPGKRFTLQIKENLDAQFVLKGISHVIER